MKVEFSVFLYFFASIILKSFGNFYLINLTTKFSYLPEFIFQMDNCSIFTVSKSNGRHKKALIILKPIHSSKSKTKKLITKNVMVYISLIYN